MSEITCSDKFMRLDTLITAERWREIVEVFNKMKDENREMVNVMRLILWQLGGEITILPGTQKECNLDLFVEVKVGADSSVTYRLKKP